MLAPFDELYSFKIYAYQNFDVKPAWLKNFGAVKDLTCLREGLVGDDLCPREG